MGGDLGQVCPGMPAFCLSKPIKWEGIQILLQIGLCLQISLLEFTALWAGEFREETAELTDSWAQLVHCTPMDVVICGEKDMVGVIVGCVYRQSSFYFLVCLCGGVGEGPPLIKHVLLLCSNTTCCKFTCYFNLQRMQWPASWRQSLRPLYNFKQYINIMEAVQLQLEIYIYICSALLQLIKVYWFCKNKKWFQVFRYLTPLCLPASVCSACSKWGMFLYKMLCSGILYRAARVQTVIFS